jgi:hypothetical protein
MVVTHLRFVQNAQLFDARWLTRGGWALPPALALPDAGEPDDDDGTLDGSALIGKNV